MGVNTTVMVAVGGWMFLQMQALKTELKLKCSSYAKK